MNIKEVKKLIVFASHPDDETIGCGGTKKLSESGCEVIVVFALLGIQELINREITKKILNQLD